MIKWNRFDTDCKNELTIFTSCISFTCPFSTIHRPLVVIIKETVYFVFGLSISQFQAWPPLPSPPRIIFWKGEFPTPRHNESTKPQPLRQKTRAKTPPPGPTRIKHKQSRIEIMKNSTEMLMYQSIPNLTTPPRETPGVLHFYTALWVGFSPNVLCSGVEVLNYRNFLLFWKKNAGTFICFKETGAVWKAGVVSYQFLQKQ